MILKKINSSLTGILNRNKRGILLILALMLVPMCVIAISVFNVFAQKDIKSNHKLIMYGLDKAPIEIVGVEANGKVIELNSPYSAGDDWLEGTAIKFKNISNKNIVYVNFGIDVKEEGSTGFLAGDDLIYGIRPGGKEMKRDEARSLAPGVIAVVSVSSRSTEEIKSILAENVNNFSHKGLKDLNLVQITLTQVVFEDGTKWSAGRYFKPDPNNPGKFIAE
jgi:hypothetical protein